jgi:hypothetical protein
MARWLVASRDAGRVRHHADPVGVAVLAAGAPKSMVSSE